jgi:hypothetical protein
MSDGVVVIVASVIVFWPRNAQGLLATRRVAKQDCQNSAVLLTSNLFAKKSKLNRKEVFEFNMVSPR